MDAYKNDVSKILELWLNISNCRGGFKNIDITAKILFPLFSTNHVSNRPITNHKYSVKTHFKFENKITSSSTAGIRLKKCKILKLSIFGVFTNTQKIEKECIVIVII